MKRSLLWVILGLGFLAVSGCATTPKQMQCAPAAAPAAPDTRDDQIKALQSDLEEQKVRAAEAEARAAKAENDLREKELLKTAKPADPYLK